MTSDYRPFNPPIEAYDWKPRGIPIGKNRILDGTTFYEAAKTFCNDGEGLMFWFDRAIGGLREQMDYLRAALAEAEKMDAVAERSGHLREAIQGAIHAMRFYVSGSPFGGDRPPQAEGMPTFSPTAQAAMALERLEARHGPSEESKMLRCAIEALRGKRGAA